MNICKESLQRFKLVMNFYVNGLKYANFIAKILLLVSLHLGFAIKNYQTSLLS